MATMHSRKRGNSGSTKPSKKTQPSWTRYKPKEIELLIVKMAKEGRYTSSIGIILRDTYGIPSVKAVLKKSISDILKEHKIKSKLPEDLLNLIKKAVAVRKHFEENRQDKTSLRGVQLTESKIKRLAKYYKKTKKLPLEWKYDPKRSSMYLD